MMFLWAFVLLAVATSSVNSQCSQSRSYNQVIQSSLEEHSTKILKNYKGGKQSLGLPSLPLLGSALPFISLTNLAFLSVQIITAEIRNTTTNGLQLKAELKIPGKCDELVDIIITVQISCGLSLTLKNGYTYFDFNEDLLQIVVDVKGNRVLGLVANLLTAVVNLLTTVLLGLFKIIFGLLICELNLLNRELKKTYYLDDVECYNSLSSVTQVGGYVSAVVTSIIDGQEIAWGQNNKYEWNQGENHQWIFDSNVITPLAYSAVKEVTTWISLSPESWSSLSWGGQYSDLRIKCAVKDLKKCEFTGKGAGLYLDFFFYVYDGTTSVASFEAEIILYANTRYRHGYFGIELLADLALDIELILIDLDSSCGCDGEIQPWLTKHLHLNLHLFFNTLSCKWGSLLYLPTVLGPAGPNGNCVSQEGNCRCSSD